MKKQFMLRIAALLMAMLMVLAVFAGCKKDKKNDDDEVDNSPEAVLRNSILSFVSDLSQREELKPLVNMTKGGSLEIKAELNVGEMAAAAGESGYTGSILGGGKFYFGDKAVLLKDLNLDIDLPPEDIKFDISGDFYMSPEYLYVSNDSILGGTLGLVRGEMKKAFQDSIFVTEGAFDTETANIIAEVLAMLDGEGVDEAAAELTALMERYVKVIFDALEDNANYKDETKEITVGGDSVSSRVITMTVDEKALVAIMKDLYNAVKNDGELRALIVKYGDMVSDYVGMSGAEIGAQYDNLLKEMENEITEFETDIEPGAFILTVATPTDASTLRKLVLEVRDGTVEDGEIETFFTLDAGKEGAKTSNRISVDVAGEMTVAYEVIKNDDTAYKASLVASSGGETMTVFTVSNDKKTNAFSFSVPEGDFVLAGTLKTEGEVTTLTINSITADGETVNKGISVSFIIDENDPMPAVLNKNEIKSIFELTKGNLVDIVDRFEKEFADLEGFFGGSKGEVEQVRYLPAGYQPYDDTVVYFAYPEGWEMTQQGDTRILQDPSGKGNNITITREERSDYYANFTNETFNSELTPVLEAQGFKVVNLNVDHTYCQNGTPITTAYYSLEYNGTIDQLLIGFAADHYTVTICVTTTDGNYDIENTVMNSLYVIDLIGAIQ